MNKPRVVLVGFGNVGRSLALELIKRGVASIVGVSSSKGSVLINSRESLDEIEKLAVRKQKLHEHSMFREEFSIDELVSTVKPELAFVTIPPSYESGEPNISIYNMLVESRVSIITSDKTVLALEYHEFMNKALEYRVYVGYRATVAAGTPAIDFARGIRGRGLNELTAILNSTTNYILSLVEDGFSVEEAINKAIEAGVAEPDPSIDVDGWDAAAKIAILACELGFNVNLRNVCRRSLRSLHEDDVRRVLREGFRYKYVAKLDSKGRAFVEPVVLRENEKLARVRGMRNAVKVVVEDEELYIEGPAGPAWRTARVMITDLIEYLWWCRRWKQ